MEQFSFFSFMNNLQMTSQSRVETRFDDGNPMTNMPDTNWNLITDVE